MNVKPLFSYFALQDARSGSRSGMSGADAARVKAGDVAKQYLKWRREAALAEHGPQGARIRGSGERQSLP
jgi:hypothetical protein